MAIRLVISVLLVVLIPLTVNAALPGFMLQRMGTLKGQAIVDGKPFGDSIVAFFLESKGLPPVSENMRRVPEFLGRTNAEGKFAIKLVAGNYYIAMLKREVGAAPGPPRAGEKYYFVADEKNNLRLFSITDKQEKDVGQVSGALPEVFDVLDELFGVEGVIVNSTTGAPYAGGVVMAKKALNIPRPDYISSRSTVDGKFKLYVAAGESYYLVARESIAGSRPRPGDYIGTYGVLLAEGNVGLMFGGGSPPPGVLEDGKQSAGRALTINGAKGEILSGIEIIVFPVPNPQEIKESLQGTAESPKFESGARLNKILFAYNSAEIATISFKELDKWASFLKGKPEVEVELSGHTDSSGSDEYNIELSSRRARAIAAYLINNGIDVLRIVAKGYGETLPVADNKTEAGRKINRRVEIKFINR